MLSFDKLEVNVGDVKYGSVASAQINVRNLNGEEIVANAPSGSCSCTTGYFEPPKIRGYGTSTLTVNFNSGKVGLGQQEKTLSVSYTFQNKTHYQTIAVKANVVQ